MSKYGKGAFSGLPRAHHRNADEPIEIPHSLSAVETFETRLKALVSVSRLSPDAAEVARRQLSERLASIERSIGRWIDKTKP